MASEDKQGMMDDVELHEGKQPVVVTSPAKSDSGVNLKKNVTIINGVGLIVGSIIGSGIFVSPEGVLKQTGSIGSSLFIWVACGIISLLGALCYGELGCEIVKSGAEHAYLGEAFGDLVAFLFAWTSTLIIRPSAATIISMIFAEYIAQPFCDEGHLTTCLNGTAMCVNGTVQFDGTTNGFCENGKVRMEYIKLLAFLCIAVITLVNCVSVKLAIRVQDFFMYAKLLCIGILIVIGFIELGKGNTQNFDDAFAGTQTSIGKISLGFYSGLWAFDGWNTLNYVTEEMKNPSRDLPISIIISMVVVTACYIIVNVGYIAVLGSVGILADSAVALDVGKVYLGKAWPIIPVLVGCSCFGAVNGLQFSSGRLVYCAAREGHLPKVLAMIQRKRFTPLPSLLFLALISCLMLIPEAADFYALIDYYSFAAWVFYGGCFVALIFLRLRRPEMKRPYKVFLPFAFLMVFVSLFLVILPVVQAPKGAGIALLMILSGIPVYVIFVYYKLHLRIRGFQTVLDKFNALCENLCCVTMPDDESAFLG